MQGGYREAPVWKVYSPDSAVRFRKKLAEPVEGELRIKACGYFTVSVIEQDGHEVKYRGRDRMMLDKKTVEIIITVSNPDTFPCLYTEGAVVTDESWMADDLTADMAAVGTYKNFNSPDVTPEIFPFAYDDITYLEKREINGGVIFDYGRETFAELTFLSEKEGMLLVSLGESIEEALDTEQSIIHDNLTIVDGCARMQASAFRYIFVDDVNVEIKARYQYLPLNYRGSFKCDEDVVNRVWDIAAYTFHLNSREFFLDGIKRDRWVWSADAYQSLFVNRYLFLDQEIEKRTLIALGGKSPVKAHINTIMDYSFFWIISLYEYYITYGDRDFLAQIYPQAKEYMQFCRLRADEDGFVRGKDGDWVFIDWAVMDKTGALCAEQVLFAKALDCYADLCHVIGREDEGCRDQAECLKKNIWDKFYDKEAGVFIDSYESGNHVVTRQSNILAYLFLVEDSKVRADIYENVVLNEEIRQISTPYFKFYENQVHCEAGNGKLLEESLRKYYGSMLETGATSLYEEYDPDKKGAEHYAMYGDAYGKSLCHAWSASPIYLLGRYRLGVKNTGIGYDSFEVAPMRGDLRTFKGTVPLPGGYVSVEVSDEMVKVMSTVEGGTLVLGDKRYALEKDCEMVCAALPRL